MTIAEGMLAATISRARPAAAPVRRWLYVVACLIALMVILGGATRLTQSGLSITEWQPIHGVVPPLTDAEWQEEFAKYRQIPEFKELRPSMTLPEFKAIFWWEWSHRLLGRLIGFAVLLPFLYFWMRGRIDRPLAAKVVVMLLLGGLQGAVGWWMVASGLVERTDVSQYRLAIHLTLACAILVYVLWVARGLAPEASFVRVGAGVRLGAAALVGLTLVQILLGALVAGLDAGLTYNTWPLMDGRLVPDGLAIETPFWRNLFENVATVQFDHRLGAYALLAAALVHALAARRAPVARAATTLAVLVLAQAGLGIATLLLAVPLPLALLHQAGAVVVLAAATLHWRAMMPAHSSR